ncbi:MAG: AAA family ATPase [Pirellulaceae bacterium]|nr:AAA family ATPase [Pirellulaceae bacterium]
MQNQFIKRDTASIVGDILPSILNDDAFWPVEPRTIQEAGIPEMMGESLICQQLLNTATLSGRNLAERIGLPYVLIEQQLSGMRIRQLITHARPAPLNDFYYSLTDNGQKRALGHQKVYSYSGPAPVPLADYILSVEAQASHFEPIVESQLKAALAGVTYDPSWLDFLGPAVNSTAGIFLYGSPGNGKTTLAKCLTACRGQEIWIPHAIIEDGNIIKLFDASYHIPSGSIAASSKIIASREHDRRWIRIRRPTVVVGGELTLDNLEVRHDARSNISEAPLQLKSNCGCLLIDDFGRQRVAPAELLNRWIVPLESKIDYLTLATGKKISVPFEQTILFSTNLQPESLVDEAFMRRVPYKIEIGDPSLAEFMELFRRACESLSMHWRPDVIEKFVEKQYRAVGRPLRRCHPRDLLAQVTALSAYHGERPELRMDYLDMAVRNYFGSSTAAISQASKLEQPSILRQNIANAPSLENSKTINRPRLAVSSRSPIANPASISSPTQSLGPIHQKSQPIEPRTVARPSIALPVPNPKPIPTPPGADFSPFASPIARTVTAD